MRSPIIFAMGLAMKVTDAVVFVTCANRGLGLAIARQARKQGAKKVYVAMR